MNREIRLTNEFKAQTVKAIVSIILFVLTYIVILLFALGLTALCVYGGFMIIAAKPMFITIALGVGLASLGVLVLIFLLKFTVKSHTVDRSHLIEITKQQEPHLYKLIEDIVQKVGTDFPKKVYLSSEVNAAVFYDSSFWSMFFPVKKNLQIGMGLVNTVSKEELTAILSHEFGHFSQRTMKVGSYVYNVNQVIFNMLYDNESYEELLHGWANTSGFFSIFVIPATIIIGMIQAILKSLYGLLNKSYMALSREMEFHADEIAASVTGYEPLKTSLLRMTLADNAFNNVLTFYDGKIKDRLKSNNVYTEQVFVMNFLAQDSSISIRNELPEVTNESFNKFNKSKLVIKDQWASHPSTDERIERLEKTKLRAKETTFVHANEIFSNIEETQKQLTQKLFDAVTYQGEIEFVSLDEFQKKFKKEFVDNSFSKIYNGYYDNKNPINFDLAMTTESYKDVDLKELFSDFKVDLVYNSIALQNDIEVLKQIEQKLINIKTFDYDGIKFKRRESKKLIQKLEAELKEATAQIKLNDIGIFHFFLDIEMKSHRDPQLSSQYSDFFKFDEDFEGRSKIYTTLSNELSFVSVTTPFEQIESNFKKVKLHETKLKSEISKLIENPIYKSEISNEMKENFDLFLSRDLEYFRDDKYIDQNLEVLFVALNGYVFLLSRGYFLLKKKLLNYQEELLVTYKKVDS